MTNLVFPVETMARELDARLVLAGLVARRRHRVFVGASGVTHRLTRQLDAGVYLGKHIFHPSPAEPLVYEEAKARGWTVLHLSEEGAVFSGDEPNWRSELDHQLKPAKVRHDDYVCTWGAFQREHYLGRGIANPAHVRVTGHPRFDLYLPAWRELFEHDVARIRAKYGRFLLVNSNFTEVVNPEGTRSSFSEPNGYDPFDDAKRLRYVGFWCRVARSVPEHVELLHRLSIQRRDLNIVFRPHPSDDMEYFEGVFNRIPNIHVVREGAVGPWLMAAGAMLHGGCTTALEAHLLGVPTITFTPDADSPHELYLPSLFGTRCTTQAQAEAAILEALERPYDLRRVAPEVSLPPRARSVFANFDGEALPTMVALLAEAEAAHGRAGGGPGRARIAFDEGRGRMVEGAKSLVRPLFRERQRSARHAAGRFPGFTREGIHRAVSAVRKLTGNPLEYTLHSPSLVELRTDKA